MEDVIVTVIGTQLRKDGEQDKIELIASGHRQQKSGVTYITYKEVLSGLEDTTTLLKLLPDRVCLSRRGAYTQNQEFYPGRTTYGMYITPYGSMKLGVSTHDLLQENMSETNITTGQTISISYELEIDGHWQSSNTLRITVAKA